MSIAQSSYVKTNSIIVSFFFLYSCASPKLDNPSDATDKAFLTTNLLKCLVGDPKVCAKTLPTPATPTIVAGNTQNTITWDAVTGATSYSIFFGTATGVTKTSGTKIASVTSPYIHSALANNTALFYVVVAVGASAESPVSAEVSATPICSPCKMYRTATLYDGNLGGISGADAKCMADANKPTSGVYKAMIVDTSTRIACTSSSCVTSGNAEHKDWVFQPTRVYVRASDGVTVLTTNSLGIWTTQTADLFVTNYLAGLRNGFNMSNVWTTNANNCVNWTDNTTGQGASANSSASLSNSTNGFGCNTAYSFVCVEQ